MRVPAGETQSPGSLTRVCPGCKPTTTGEELPHKPILLTHTRSAQSGPTPEVRRLVGHLRNLLAD